MGEGIYEGYEIFEFKSSKKPVIDHLRARKLLDKIEMGQKKIYIDVTLGKVGETVGEVVNDEIFFYSPFTNEEYYLPIEILKKIAIGGQKVYRIEENGGIIPLEIRSKHYYKLWTPSIKYAPTLSIDGINMHRIKDINPYVDAKIKVSTLNIKPKKMVLDICTGLGYTAIWAKKFGGDVTTIEIDENVLSLAQENPWSEELEEIKIIRGDATYVIQEMPKNIFDYIIHDPPRISLAGELYSQDFYYELNRVLKRGGRLFHYTGQPGEKYRGKRIIKGIGERLRNAGFSVKFVEKAKGFLAIKKFDVRR